MASTYTTTSTQDEVASKGRSIFPPWVSYLTLTPKQTQCTEQCLVGACPSGAATVHITWDKLTLHNSQQYVRSSAKAMALHLRAQKQFGTSLHFPVLPAPVYVF
jgi:hypothetical protein